MSPERDEPTDDQDLYEDVPPRSIFAATWFRVVLVLIVLGVFGAVAVPYVLDWMNPPPTARSVSAKATPAAPISPLPTSDSAVSSGPDKSTSAERKDLTPPPAAPSLAKPESESKPTPAPKMPAPKSEAKSTTSESKSVASGDASAKSAMAARESVPKTSTKSAAAAKSDSATKSSTPPQADSAKSQAVAKAEPPKDETRPATASAPAAAKRAVAKATSPSASTPKSGEPFWVQVGAFKDPETAKRVANGLRSQNYKVEESETRASAKSAATAAATSSSAGSSPAASPGDLYDVYVSGTSAVELTKRLSAKGLAAEASGGSVVVKPSLPLRDAVTLSKDLAVDGLKVQVRRAGSGAPVAAPVTTTPPVAGETLHRVRVGGFADAASARAAAKELEGKGYKPYIARGNE